MINKILVFCPLFTVYKISSLGGSTINCEHTSLFKIEEEDKNNSLIPIVICPPMNVSGMFWLVCNTSCNVKWSKLSLFHTYCSATLELQNLLDNSNHYICLAVCLQCIMISHTLCLGKRTQLTKEEVAFQNNMLRSSYLFPFLKLLIVPDQDKCKL